MNKIKAKIVFSGCGGMYHYISGIASVIQEQFDLTDVIITSASAGCFPAVLLALNINIIEAFNNWNIPFLKEVNSYLLGSLGIWNSIVKKWTIKYLNDDKDYYKKAINKLFCSITTVNFSLTKKPIFENILVSDWKSNEDLVDGIMSSAFVPLFDIGKLTNSYRNKKCIDGSLTNNQPDPYPESDVPTIVITYDMYKTHNKSWYLVWCWSSPKWSTELFEMGRRDTLNNLSKFENILPRK
jgi:hypothetical protein